MENVGLKTLSDTPIYMAWSIWGCNHRLVAPPDRGAKLVDLSVPSSPKSSPKFICNVIDFLQKMVT
jgi:hypothetical protein